MFEIERALMAQEFLITALTSRERMLVAALAVGIPQCQIARCWGTTPAAVSQMARRIIEKAGRFWHHENDAHEEKGLL
jgi:DNA-binding NarL/FixJ family response regulator